MPASRSGLDTLSEKSSTFNQHSTNTSAAHSAEQGTAQPPHSPHNSGHYLLNPLLSFPKKSLDFSMLGILNSPQCRMSSQGHQKGSSGTQDPGNLLGEALQAQPISPHQPQSTQKWASLKTAALHFSLNRKPGVYCPSNVFLKTPAVSIWGPTARANSCSSFLPWHMPCARLEFPLQVHAAARQARPFNYFWKNNSFMLSSQPPSSLHTQLLHLSAVMLQRILPFSKEIITDCLWQFFPVSKQTRQTMAQISDPCHILGNNLIIRMNVFKAQH